MTDTIQKNVRFRPKIAPYPEPVEGLLTGNLAFNLDERVAMTGPYKIQDFLDVFTLTVLSTRSISSLLHLGHFSLCSSCSFNDSTISKL